MTLLRAWALGFILCCSESSGETEDVDTPILPPDAIEAIEATSCPEIARVSVEACLVWLNSDAARGNSDQPPPAIADSAEPVGAVQQEGLLDEADGLDPGSH